MSDEIIIACLAADMLDIDDMTALQGNLKNFPPEKEMQLRESILEGGFSFPIFIWIENESGTNYIMDGTHRKIVLTKLREEGYSVPPIPVAYINAKSYSEAKKKLLQCTSRFANITKEGLTEYVIDFDTEGLAESISLEVVDFEIGEIPGLGGNIEAPKEKINGNEEIDVDDLTKNLNTICPKCKFEFQAARNAL